MLKIILAILGCCVLCSCASNSRLVIPTPPEPYNFGKIENIKDMTESLYGLTSYSKEMIYYVNTIYRMEYGSNYYNLTTNDSGYPMWITPKYKSEN